MSSKLSPLQQKVFDLLDKKPNTDVHLGDLFEAAYRDERGGMRLSYYLLDNRERQQKMGPLFARINSKLKNGKIEPGLLKQTYRLTIEKD